MLVAAVLDQLIHACHLFLNSFQPPYSGILALFFLIPEIAGMFIAVSFSKSCACLYVFHSFPTQELVSALYCSSGISENSAKSVDF